MIKAESYHFREIADAVALRVGSVGQRDVDIGQPSGRYESITLSRGGIVIPDQSAEENYEARYREHVYKAGDQEGQLIYPNANYPATPIAKPSLAVIKHLVGEDDKTGKSCANYGGGILLDDELSRTYVLDQGEDGLWHAFDAFAESVDFARLYYIDAARPITAYDEVVSIKGLFTAFDQCLARETQEAAINFTGLQPQGNF